MFRLLRYYSVASGLALLVIQKTPGSFKCIRHGNGVVGTGLAYRVGGRVHKTEGVAAKSWPRRADGEPGPGGETPAAKPGLKEGHHEPGPGGTRS